jgi:hypothetical protein
MSRKNGTTTFTSNTLNIPINTSTTITGTISSDASGTLTAGQRATITFTLSTSTTLFDLSYVNCTGGILTDFSGSGVNYTARFTPNTNSTTSGVISMSGTNGTTTFTSSTRTITIDTRVTAVTCTITSTKTEFDIGDTATITFSMSPPTTKFEDSMIMMSGGTLGTITSEDNGARYIATFTPDVDSFNAFGYISVSGTSSDDTTTITSYSVGLRIDTRLDDVTCTISSSKTVFTSGDTSIITFSMNPSTLVFDSSLVDVSGGTLGTITTNDGGATYTATFTPNENILSSGTKFRTADGALYNYDGTILYSFYDYTTTSFTIPDNVTTITKEAFVSTSITGIVIPSSVTSIGDKSFSNCSNLTTIVFEGNRPTIANDSFEGINSSAMIYYYTGNSDWPDASINGITPTVYNSFDVFTPYTFKSIISNTFSHEIDISNTSITRLNRYILAPASAPTTYLTITDSYDLSFVQYANMTTYKDYLLTIFQAVSDLSGTSAFSTTDFRFDSNFHNVYSLDCDSSLNLLLTNNWGIDRTTSNGYVTFSYVDNYLQAKARYKYDPSGTNQHVTDSTFTGTNYYVKYNSTGLSLVNSTSNATQFILYSSPFEESLPDDFNPKNDENVTNSRVSINSSVSNIESELYTKLIKDMSKDAYLNQVSAVGPDSTTRSAAESMLATIKSTVEDQGNVLRYDTSIYSTFRDGALSFQLQTNSAGNGTVGMYTVPYVYFTCEADASGTYGAVGKYHPFMCVVSYGISDRPCGLMDIPKPPGDGVGGGYENQTVTRDQTIGFLLSKIPMLDYGTVNDVSENMIMLSRNLRDESGYDEKPPYDIYNYSMSVAAGIMIDGVTIFPVMNNILNTAQFQAEITPKGHHVGRSLAGGLHYHADGHAAHANNIFNVYNNLDYVGRFHPPLIGFSLDGIALYGKYEHDYSTMSGYSIALDEYGAHEHGDYGYHYHSHEVNVNETYEGSATTLYDYSVMYQNNPTTLSYTGHVLLPGAYKGNVDEVPYFLESGLNQSTVFVGKNTV